MAKKKKLSAPQEAAPARASFLPVAEDIKAPEPMILEADGPKGGHVRLSIETAADRTLAVTLTIQPLRPCVEKIFLPVKSSPEQLASIVAGAVMRAAKSAEADGIFQHATKESEEAESKARFANR